MDENVVVTYEQQLVEVNEMSEEYGSDTEYDISSLIEPVDTAEDDMQV